MRKEFCIIGKRRVIVQFENEPNFPSATLVFDKEKDQFVIDNSFILDYLNGDEVKKISEEEFMKF
jgi:membrane-associated PAP2 superfamily phosphatase